MYASHVVRLQDTEGPHQQTQARTTLGTTRCATTGTASRGRGRRGCGG